MSFVALIAGQGVMPIKVIQELKNQQKKILLIAIKGITPESLVEFADKVIWGNITQIGKARSACLKYNAKEAVMAGLIKHNRIFNLSLLAMDFTTLKMFLGLKDLRADTICRNVIKVFETKGIFFMDTTKILQRYLAKDGILTKVLPTKKISQDIEFGIQIAKELGRLDIGQCVVVKNKSIVAVEAMEGTDQCLQRAGDLAGKGCVVVKLAKPNQDKRFDVPVVGLNTIEKLIKIEAAALAIEADCTLILDPEVVELANKHQIAIVSIAIN